MVVVGYEFAVYHLRSKGRWNGMDNVLYNVSYSLLYAMRNLDSVAWTVKGDKLRW